MTSAVLLPLLLLLFVSRSVAQPATVSSLEPHGRVRVDACTWFAQR